jgi:hypothetical protein
MQGICCPEEGMVVVLSAFWANKCRGKLAPVAIPAADFKRLRRLIVMRVVLNIFVVEVWYSFENRPNGSDVGGFNRILSIQNLMTRSHIAVLEFLACRTIQCSQLTITKTE